MTFSNVNIFRSAVKNLKASDPGATADKITRGGAFSPNTQETIAIMRSEVDNQWENSFIIKYQALMQNRLNRLRQDLTNAYKSILEVSTVQQVRTNGITSANSALTDVYGRVLNNASDAFKSLTYYDNATAFANDDYNDNSSVDGVPSYYLNTQLTQTGTGAQAARNGNVEMRKLYVTGPALQVVNSMKVTFRTEEVPPKFTDVSILGVPIPFVGQKAFTPGEKVAEYSADVKAGGFFSTVNYLYNFAPRELKYTYPTAYSTTTEEAGSRQVTNKVDLNGDGDFSDTVGGRSETSQGQALLFNSQILDARDVKAGSNGNLEDDSIPSYTDTTGNLPPNGARVKWGTSNTNQGYQTERTPMFIQRSSSGGTLPGVDPIDDRAISRRKSDNDNNFNMDLIGNANGTVKGPDPDPLRNNPWAYTAGTTGNQTVYGTEELTGGSDSIANRIKWEYNHDGIGAADLNQDGNIDNNDVHQAKALFINHYQVQTQSVELNSSSKSYGGVKALEFRGDGKVGVDTVRKQNLLRSTGIDGSAEHVFNDENGDKFQQSSPDEKLLLAGSGKIAKNFDGKFVAGLYNLQSFNGQDVATETANVSINSKNDKDQVVIAEYEGFKRAATMNKGLADDFFSQINNRPRSEADAIRLVKKFETEVNASTMVDTDWHYSEYLTGDDKVMFRHIPSVSYTSSSGSLQSLNVKYRPNMVDSTTGNYKDIVVGFRKPFSLEPRDFQTATYSNSANADIYINTPTYNDRDVFVDIITTNAGTAPDLIVNGKIVPPVSAGRYNLRGFLQPGDNVIAAQVKFDQTNPVGESFRLISSPGANATDIDTWVTAKLSTDRASNGDTAADKLDKLKNNLSNSLSSWQSKIMVDKITPVFFPNPTEYQIALDTLGSVRTATKVKENNAFSRLLTEALNKPEYQDIFNMGLLNTLLGKTMTIKAQVSAPTGGSVNATMDIQYDPISNKFILVQKKFDAFGGV